VAFRFTDEELELLEVIQGHTGIRSRMEALRTVLRYYAKDKGLEVEKPESPTTPEASTPSPHAPDKRT
jgi:hypothetical protein